MVTGRHYITNVTLSQTVNQRDVVGQCNTWFLWMRPFKFVEFRSLCLSASCEFSCPSVGWIKFVQFLFIRWLTPWRSGSVVSCKQERSVPTEDPESIRFPNPLSPELRVTGSWSCTQRSQGEDRVTPWTRCQFISEPREANNHSFTLTPTISSSKPTWHACFWTFGTLNRPKT